MPYSPDVDKSVDCGGIVALTRPMDQTGLSIGGSSLKRQMSAKAARCPDDVSAMGGWIGVIRWSLEGPEVRDEGAKGGQGRRVTGLGVGLVRLSVCIGAHARRGSVCSPGGLLRFCTKGRSGIGVGVNLVEDENEEHSLRFQSRNTYCSLLSSLPSSAIASPSMMPWR